MSLFPAFYVSHPASSIILFLFPSSTSSTILLPFYIAYSSSVTLSSPIPILSPNFPFSLKLSPLPFPLNLSEPIPLKLRLLRIQKLNSIFFYIPWTKVELWTIVKDFLKVTEDCHRFSEEFDTAIQTYQPGYSDLNQLVIYLSAKARPSFGWKNCQLGKSWKISEITTERPAH